MARRALPLALAGALLAPAAGGAAGRAGALAPSVLLRSQPRLERASAAVAAGGGVELRRVGSAAAEDSAAGAGRSRSSKASAHHALETEKEAWVEYLMMPNDDLVAIKKGPATDSEKTEVQVTSVRSNYTEVYLKNSTALDATDGRWCFLPTPEGDIMAVLTGPITASGMTELYVLTRDSNFSSIALQVGTGLKVTSLREWSFLLDRIGDLWCVKKADCEGGVAEMHILTKSSNYQNFSYHGVMGLPEERAEGARFFATPKRDLLVVELAGGTKGTATAELLTRESGYKERLFRSDTGLALQGGQDQFVMRRDGDLVYVERPSPQGPVKEAYMAVLSQQSHYTQIISELTTAFTD